MSPVIAAATQLKVGQVCCHVSLAFETAQLFVTNVITATFPLSCHERNESISAPLNAE